MKINFSRRIVVAALFALLSSAGLADPVTGTPPLGSYAGGPFDSVNLANLNVSFSIPIFNRPGKGMPFFYNLTYNSLIWNPTAPDGAAVWTPATNWGWTASSDGITGYVTYGRSTTSYSCYVYEQGYEYTVSTYSDWIYHDPSGGSHPFPGSIVVTHISSPDCGTVGTTFTPITNAATLDNSGYIVSTNSSLWDGPTTVKARGGLAIITPPVGSATGSGSVTDANGNQILVNYNATTHVTTINDTLGTTALTINGNPPTSNCESSPVYYKYNAPSGTATVTISYKTRAIRTYFRVSGISEFPTTNECLVDKVTLPDSSYYQFAYECINLGNGCDTNETTARMASVTLPNGGPINYSYNGTDCGNDDNCMMADGSPSALTDALGGGSPQTWSYTRGYQNGLSYPLQTTTKINDYAGNETDLKFSGLYETSRTVHQGSAVLDYADICYNGNTSSCATATVANPIIQRVKNNYPDNTSLHSTVQQDYDAYGNTLDEYDYNYGMTGQQQAAGITIASYDTGLCSRRNICNKPDSVKVADGSHQEAKTSYTYDGNGNTLTMSKWVSGSTSLTWGYTYNTGSGEGGTLAAATDPNGMVTDYHSGGYACSGAFPLSVSVPGDGGVTLTTSYTYNCTGGVVTSTSVKDNPNNATVSSTYSDPYFWRPASAIDALGNVTHYNYYGVNNSGSSAVTLVGQVESVMYFNDSNSTVDKLSTPEIFGRPFLNQMREGPGSNNWDTVEYRYDGANRLGRADYPYVSTAGSQGNEGSPTNYSYDALGRVVDITDNTGIDTHYSYFLNDTKVTVNPAPAGENTKRRQIEYDVLGHPTSVCEVITGSGTSCGQHSSANGYITTYQYDLLGNLTSVIQSGQGRAFTYDGLSRMTAETNPESGTTNYTFDSVAAGYCSPLVQQYSSPGDLVAKADANGENHICYYYDLLHRLTDVGNNSQIDHGGINPCLRFRYDNSQGADGAIPQGISPTYNMGRLVEAATDDCNGHLLTDEWFSYSPRGDDTDRWESTPHSGGWYHVQQSYFANGAVASLQGFIGTGGSPAFTDLLTYNVDRKGRPYSAVDTTTEQYPHVWPSTAYNAANQPTQVNLVRSSEGESFSYDGNSGSMTQWSSVAGSNNQTGNLTWNANGTLYQLAITDTADSGNNQTCTNMYDDLERLIQNSCGGSPGWAQSFSYDAFGNISKSTYNLNYAWNNRILGSGFTYDGMGNVTHDEMYNYSYDAEGHPITISGNGINGVQITYDAFGRAVEQYNNNNDNAYTQTVYSPSGSLYAIMNGTTVQKYFVPLAAGMQAIYNGSGLQYYRYSDWLGSNRLSITPAGAVYFDGAYAPFAENYAGIGTSDRVFTGQPMNTVPHLYDFPSREYSQDQGRWLVPDPAGLSAVDITNPQTWNRYAYVENNPLSNVDPLGLYDCDDYDSDCTGSESEGGGGDGGSSGGGDTGCAYDACVVAPPPPDVPPEEVPLPPAIPNNPDDGCAYDACVTDTMPPDVPTEDSGSYRPVYPPTTITVDGGKPPQVPTIPSTLPGSIPTTPIDCAHFDCSNGNTVPGFTPQDGICSGPAFPLNLDPGALACCNLHDRCYTKYQCNQSSWHGPLNSACQHCNEMVVGCMAIIHNFIP